MKFEAKRIGATLLRRFGFERRRGPALSPEVIAARAGAEASYYREYTSRWPIFSPWVTLEAQALYAQVAKFTAGTPERAYMLGAFAQYARMLPGDFAEAGVYHGGSAFLLCRALQGIHKKLFLFDSFKGLPDPNSHHDPVFQKGEYAAPVDSVRERLQEFGHIAELREGWIPNTFAGLENKQYSFAHIDLDLYQPTLDACEYFYPRLTTGGVMLFDEYGFSSAHGEKVAVDEFFADKREQPTALITGQAFVIKLPPPNGSSRT